MNFAHRSPRRLFRWISLVVGFAVITTSLAVAPVSFLRPSVSAQNDQSIRQSDQSNGKATKVKPDPPDPGPPEFTLPNLDEVSSQPEGPETPLPISSSVRSKRKPLESRKGKKVGDPGTTGAISQHRGRDKERSSALRKADVNVASTNRLTAQLPTNRLHHSNKSGNGTRATSPTSPLPLPDDQFVSNFLLWALPNDPTASDEATYWKDILRSAYPQGPDVMLVAAREMGATIFESAQYAARPNRNCSNLSNSHNYVYDLYKTYSMREPDQSGWDFWASQCQTMGQAATRAAFDQSFEFQDLVATITPNGTISGPLNSIAAARVDPFNQTGDQLAARDCEWSLPLLSLPGRAGLDLGLGLSYSSLVFTRSGPYFYFDQDNSSISPGFRLGFASVQGPYFDAQVGKKVYLLVSSSGLRIELRQLGGSNVYEAADSSYLQLIDNTALNTGLTWTNDVGVAVAGNSLTKTASTAWTNAGAVSNQWFDSGDGYMEVTASETNTARMIGLSNGDSNQNYPDIDFAFYLTSGDSLLIYEDGVSRGNFGMYLRDDVLRVAVEGGVVKYRKNGTLLYTSTVTPTYPLLVDTALYTTGSTLNNVVIGGDSGGGIVSSMGLSLRTTEGTQLRYQSYANGWQPTEVKDRNGNYLTIDNDWLGNILDVTDTLGRVINFNYDANANLLSITQSGIIQPLATFSWGAAFSMNVGSFTGVVGTYNGESIPVLRQVGLNNGSYYTFEYTTAGQVNMIRRKTTSDNVERSHMAYDYDSPSDDCPRITQTRVSADNWTGLNGVPTEVTTQFAAATDKSWAKVTSPDGTIYKEFFPTANWQRGLATEAKIYLSSTAETSDSWQKRTVTAWAHDGAANASYPTNPRVAETNLYDSSGNRRRTTIGYTTYSLPADVYEYAADATTVLRRNHTDYNLATIYTNRRIIGLPSAQYLCDGAQGPVPCSNSSGASLLAKSTSQYDETGSVQFQSSPVQHDDDNYGSGFIVGRGNLSSVRRYNVSNLAQYTTNSAKYDTAGSTISVTDALSHVSAISYADSFSDGSDHNTYAYPTTVTDADNVPSLMQYDFDYGTRTRVEDPLGAIQTITYDSARRITRETTTNTGAYTRYIYGPNYVQSWSTVNSVADQAYTKQVFDGAGRIIGAASNHPGSTGGYKVQLTKYDLMGRAIKQSNPTEVNASWVPMGDDSGATSGALPVVWTNDVGVSLSGNNLTKTGANGWGTGGASSTLSIASGDGYVETTANETNKARMIGLSKGDSNQNYTEIDFAIYLTSTNSLMVYEGGVSRGTFGTYATGDVLRVAVEGGVVKYRKNGTLLYTSAVAPTYPLLVDTALYTTGSTLNNVMIYGAFGGSGGMVYTQQTYDWKGRPLITTNTDGTQRSASYAGCGCAGDEVVTLTDELGRQQKVYSDPLGRQWKTEVLNLNDTVYSSNVSVYNSRDQVTNIKEYSGLAPPEATSTNAAASCPSGTCQETIIGYDGYARVLTKHVPEQNAGTNTVYAYNNDDTLQRVTDPRGSYATYGYVGNNRHLVTSITYQPAAGVTDTHDVGFQYDAAGNRISMTDGLGSQSYTYNQLSQLLSETRTFTGVGAFTLSYDYNLVGELKKITDPTNMTINYAFDNAGRLSGVTGSNVLVGGVSNYASGFKYRAWGSLKQMSAGLNHTASFGYNARLQPDHFDISGGVVNQDYDYDNGGRVSFVHNTTDNNFDRAYTYDHAARLTAAASGGEARHDLGAVPMYETLQYNAWNDITSRVNESWLNDFYDAGTYTNHRRAGWSYDVAGRVLTIDTRAYIYDAAGQTISLTGQRWTSSGYVPTTTTSNFDGDGNRVKEASDSFGYPTTTYYLRSSVLRGAIVEEMNSSGQKQLGYVYTAEGGLLARQAPSTDYVSLKQVSPIGVSQYEFSFSSTTPETISRREFDPAGANVPLNDHSSLGHGGDPGDIPGGGGPSDSRFGALENPGAGCVLDGVYAPCDWISRGLESGSIEREYWGPALSHPSKPSLKPTRQNAPPSQAGIQLTLAHMTEPIVSFGLGLYGTEVAKAVRADNEGGHLEYGTVLFTGPQNATPVDQLLDRARQLHNQPNRNDCLALVDLIRTSARLFPNVISATAALGTVLTGSSSAYELAIRERTNDMSNAIVNFGNDGFRAAFVGVKGDNQVRHFMAGLLGGESIGGTNALSRMNAREVGNGINEVADRNLNAVSTDLGDALRTHNVEYGLNPGLVQAEKLNWLADQVRDKVCN